MISKPYTKKVQAYLDKFEDVGESSMENFCAKNKFSELDLHFKLIEEGASWNKLKEGVRKARCAEYALKHPRSKQDALAASCGYRDVPYISIKFKQWFGFTWTDYKVRPTDHHTKVLRDAAFS